MTRRRAPSLADIPAVCRPHFSRLARLRRLLVRDRVLFGIWGIIMTAGALAVLFNSWRPVWRMAATATLFFSPFPLMIAITPARAAPPSDHAARQIVTATTDRQIVACAMLMLRRHGLPAPNVAADLATRAHASGDIPAAIIWHKVESALDAAIKLGRLNS